MTAWKLTTDFNEQQHLFFEKIETDYVVEAYACSCGHTDFIIKSQKQEFQYVCSECENDKFNDANNAWRNTEHFLYQNLDLKLLFAYDIHTEPTKVVSRYITQIPTEIDFLNKKIIFSKKSLYSFTLTSEGDLEENYALHLKRKIYSELKKRLIHYINKSDCFNIPHSKGKELNLKMASFFLKNSHLQDFDFYYWSDVDALGDKEIDIKSALSLVSNGKKEKSVKKAIYQNYMNQMNENQKFYSTFIEIFTENIEDINILVALLGIRFERSSVGYIEKDALRSLIVFLKENYTEKQMLALFSKEDLSAQETLFTDAVNEFNYDEEVIREKFRKVDCKIEVLHDEFVRCAREKRYQGMVEQKLYYSKKEIEPCVQTDIYTIKLPRNGQELYEWADELHNCMAGYFKGIQSHETIKYGFFQEDNIQFAVEIGDKKIIQSSGKYNASLTVKENEALTKWFKIYFQEDAHLIEDVA